ncbi:DUF3734 domain-containing protein [Segnochrobactraceae bacterium EtOH-i3]
MPQTTPPDFRPDDFPAVRDRIREAYSNVVLVLQGGGALGSYQPGVVEVLERVGIDVNWVAGISIGAINSAIIAGNPPGQRLAKLTEFWNLVTSRVKWPWVPDGDELRGLFNQAASYAAITMGQPGFFKPRFPPPELQPQGTASAVSYYDTSPLRETLLKVVDFDYLNEGPVRLSVGAVNVRSGNFVYFDNRQRRIRPEHIMASGSLPPGFPPVEIDGEYYWDGGLVSNTPLSYVLGHVDACSLIFQVDLFSAHGIVPRNMGEVQEREKDIRFSSRTRMNTDIYKTYLDMRGGIDLLMSKLPPEALADPEVAALEKYRTPLRANIMHLIYRRKMYDKAFKDYEFSRNTMLDHWSAGRDTMTRTLRHADWFEPPRDRIDIVTHDVHHDADD